MRRPGNQAALQCILRSAMHRLVSIAAETASQFRPPNPLVVVQQFILSTMMVLSDALMPGSDVRNSGAFAISYRVLADAIDPLLSGSYEIGWLFLAQTLQLLDQSKANLVSGELQIEV